MIIVESWDWTWLQIWNKYKVLEVDGVCCVVQGNEISENVSPNLQHIHYLLSFSLVISPYYLLPSQQYNPVSQLTSPATNQPTNYLIPYLNAAYVQIQNYIHNTHSFYFTESEYYTFIINCLTDLWPHVIWNMEKNPFLFITHGTLDIEHIVDCSTGCQLKTQNSKLTLSFAPRVI